MKQWLRDKVFVTYIQAEVIKNVVEGTVHVKCTDLHLKIDKDMSFDEYNERFDEVDPNKNERKS